MAKHEYGSNSHVENVSENHPARQMPYPDKYQGVQGTKRQGIVSKALQGDKTAIADYAKMTMEDYNKAKKK
jgi:hypothetical protein